MQFKRVRLTTRDTIRQPFRNWDFLITPQTRITAEPGNPPQRCDFGRLWDGSNSGEESPGADIETIWSSIQKGLSLLSPADQVAIRQKMFEYSGQDPGPVNAAGVKGLDSNRRIAAQVEAIRAVQKANDDFWDWTRR